MKILNQTIKIPHIDSKKIADGEILFRGRICDKNGNYLRGAPYIEKEYSKLELKILPSNFEKALNSGDKTVSEAYRKWRERDFPDWWTMGGLEEEWQKSQPRYFEKELLEIFPEARPLLNQQLKEYQEEIKNLTIGIQRDLSQVYETVRDEFSIWFCEKIIEIWKGERLNWLNKRVKELKCILDSENFKKKRSEITDEMIQRAREYPFEQLIKFNQAKKALCVFHNEKHPSLSLNPKTNRIKCFGCGINYDPIEYIMKAQNLSFIEAVKYLNDY